MLRSGRWNIVVNVVEVVVGVYVEMIMIEQIMLLLLLLSSSLLLLLLLLLTGGGLLERRLKFAFPQLALIITLYRPCEELLDLMIGITCCTEFTHYNTLSLLRHISRKTNHFSSYTDGENIRHNTTFSDITCISQYCNISHGRLSLTN
jgi:hypothetical protein